MLAGPQSSPSAPAGEGSAGRLCPHLQAPRVPALAVWMNTSSSDLMVTCLPLWKMPRFGGEQTGPPLTLSQASRTPSLLRHWRVALEGTQEGEICRFVPNKVPVSLADSRSHRIPKDRGGYLQKKGSHLHYGSPNQTWRGQNCQAWACGLPHRKGRAACSPLLLCFATSSPQASPPAAGALQNKQVSCCRHQLQDSRPAPCPCPRP